MHPKVKRNTKFCGESKKNGNFKRERKKKNTATKKRPMVYIYVENGVVRGTLSLLAPLLELVDDLFA